jgi:hypothetical protein
MRTISPTPQKSTTSALASSLNNAANDVYRGFIHTTQNSLALLGTVAAVVLLVFGMRADLRASGEERLLSWLLQRQEAQQLVEREVEVEPTAIDRGTVANLRDLTDQQAKVTQWLSRKYRVAPEPVGALVAEAYQIGERTRLDPTLLLAVMAIESRFNPFAQSPVGAQGLMQVLTRVHTDKYVGAVSTDGSWYINRVMAEHLRIQRVAQGKPLKHFDTPPPVRAIPVNAPAPDSEVEAEIRPNAATPPLTAIPS